MKPRAVHQPGNHLPHIIGLPRRGRDNAIELLRVIERFFRRRYIANRAPGVIEILNNIAADLKRMLIIFRQMIRYPGTGAVHFAAAEFFGRDVFAN